MGKRISNAGRKPHAFRHFARKTKRAVTIFVDGHTALETAEYLNWLAEKEDWAKVNPSVGSVKPPEGQYSRTVGKRADPVPLEIAQDPPKPLQVVPVGPKLPPSRFIRKISVPFDRKWGKRSSFAAMLRHQLEEEIIYCGACEKEHANHISHCSACA